MVLFPSGFGFQPIEQLSISSGQFDYPAHSRPFFDDGPRPAHASDFCWQRTVSGRRGVHWIYEAIVRKPVQVLLLNHLLSTLR